MLKKIFVYAASSLLIFAFLFWGYRTSLFNQSSSLSYTDDVIRHSFLSEQVVVHNIPDFVTASRGMGFVLKEDLEIPPLNRNQTEEFILSQTGSFDPYLILINKSNEPLPVLISTILNYEQVKYFLDGEYGLLHSIVIPPQEEVNIPLKISIGEVGVHDLFVVAFPYFTSHPKSNEERYDPNYEVFGRRTVVKVGGVDLQPPHLPIDVFGSEISRHPGAAIKTVALVKNDIETQKHPAYRQFALTEVEADGEFKYQIVAENEHTESDVRYALLLFLDFHQVKINNKNTLVARINYGQEVTINGVLTLPEELGIHELQLIYLFDPYRSILNNEVTAPIIFSTLRYGLITADEQKK